eukprot:RCo023104
MSADPKDRIVVIGAGTAGLSASSRLLKKDSSLKVTILDKSQNHYYQPGWTFVGAGIFDFASTVKDTKDFIPKGAKWEPVNAKEVRPEVNTVVTEDGREFKYDYLVVAAGIQLDWDKIAGLKETLGKNGVCSNYSGGVNTWEFVKALTSGTALFTFRTPLKCGGAPMKAMFMSWDYWNTKGVAPNINITYATTGTSMFPIKKYNDAIEKICTERRLNRLYGHNLIAVDGLRKIATFSTPEGTNKELAFDLLHVAPPMSAPEFLKGSPIANKDGFVDVDDSTLQHKKYPNIFAVGDCSAVPTSKTAAAICRQSPVLVHNLMQHRAGKPLNAHYDGYASCPLVTGVGSLLLMEFGYQLKLMEHMPWDQGVHDGLRGMIHYFVKKYVFPPTYWHGILKGCWYGPSGPFPAPNMIVKN